MLIGTKCIINKNNNNTKLSLNCIRNNNNNKIIKPTDLTCLRP